MGDEGSGDVAFGQPVAWRLGRKRGPGEDLPGSSSRLQRFFGEAPSPHSLSILGVHPTPFSVCPKRFRHHGGGPAFRYNNVQFMLQSLKKLAEDNGGSIPNRTAVSIVSGPNPPTREGEVLQI